LILVLDQVLGNITRTDHEWIWRRGIQTLQYSVYKLFDGDWWILWRTHNIQTQDNRESIKILERRT